MKVEVKALFQKTLPFNLIAVLSQEHFFEYSVVLPQNKFNALHLGILLVVSCIMILIFATLITIFTVSSTLLRVDSLSAIFAEVLQPFHDQI